MKYIIPILALIGLKIFKRYYFVSYIVIYDTEKIVGSCSHVTAKGTFIRELFAEKMSDEFLLRKGKMPANVIVNNYTELSYFEYKLNQNYWNKVKLT